MTPNSRQVPSLNQEDIQSFGWDVGKIDLQRQSAHSAFVSPKMVDTPNGKKKSIVVMRKRSKNS
jgi:hypothetical protein